MNVSVCLLYAYEYSSAQVFHLHTLDLATIQRLLDNLSISKTTFPKECYEAQIANFASYTIR